MSSNVTVLSNLLISNPHTSSHIHPKNTRSLSTLNNRKILDTPSGSVKLASAQNKEFNLVLSYQKDSKLVNNCIIHLKKKIATGKSRLNEYQDKLESTNSKLEEINRNLFGAKKNRIDTLKQNFSEALILRNEMGNLHSLSSTKTTIDDFLSKNVSLDKENNTHKIHDEFSLSLLDKHINEISEHKTNNQNKPWYKQNKWTPEKNKYLTHIINILSRIAPIENDINGIEKTKKKESNIYNDLYSKLASTKNSLKKNTKSLNEIKKISTQKLADDNSIKTVREFSSEPYRSDIKNQINWGYSRGNEKHLTLSIKLDSVFGRAFKECMERAYTPKRQLDLKNNIERLVTILKSEYSSISKEEGQDLVKEIKKYQLELKQINKNGKIDISQLPEISITDYENNLLLTIELAPNSVATFLSSCLAASRDFTLAKEIERRILNEENANHVSDHYLQALVMKIKEGLRLSDKIFGAYSFDDRPGGHIVQLIDKNGNRQKKMMPELYFPSRKHALEVSTVIKTQVDDKKLHHFSFIDPVSLEIIKKSPPGTRFTGVMIPPDAWIENAIPPQCIDNKGKTHPLLVMVPTLTADYATNSGKRYYGQDTNPPTPRSVSRYFNGPDFKQKEDSDSKLNNASFTDKLKSNYRYFEADTTLNPKK